MKKFLYILVIVFLLPDSAFTGSIEDAEMASLAVLVDYQPNSVDFAGKLQPLLEAEASMQWSGRLVERAKLNKLLEELKISISRLIGPSEIDSDSRLQLGKLIHIDCLLSVTVASDSVKATVSLFPSTAVIYERTYRERLRPHPLAVRIITDALKAFREHNRNPNIPQISIGSFYYADPHRRFFEFSRDINERLRRQLVEIENMVLTERLLPSQLLSEFELVRGGFTEQVARCVSAPASDILLFGEFQPRPEQELESKAMVLDYKLFVLSPTGLCKNRQVESSCLSNKPEAVTHQAVKLIEQAADEVRKRLAAGEKRSFSQQEFEAFKKQAFRLMSSPPHEDGDFYKQGYYRGPIQLAPLKELKRALHMLECAMLFKGDDTQVLVCMGAVLEGLYRKGKSTYSRDDSLLDAGLDLIERAYYLDSNWNTRGMYWRFCMHGGLVSAERRPTRSLDAARQIWNTRQTEPWHPHETRSAFSILFESEKDLQQQCKIFVEAAPEYEKAKDGLRELFNLFSLFRRKVFTSDGDPGIIKQNHHVADRLLEEQSIFLRSLGHLLHLAIYFEMGKAKEGAGTPAEYVEHFHAAVNMLPSLYEKYGKEFNNCTFSNRLRESFETYEKVLQKYSLEDDSVELKERYIDIQMRAGNYNSGGLVQVFRTLLPMMWERCRYERAYELITEFLDHYAVGGSADYERMWLARQRNRFMFAMQGRTPLSINQVEKIEFDDGDTGWVTKVVAADNGIFGICSNQWFRDGKIFRLVLGTQQANILKHVSGEVRDLARAGSFVGIATLNGFYIMDMLSLETQHFTVENSGLPGQKVTLVCESGKDFYIAIPDKKNLYTLIYRLQPDAAKIGRTDTKFSRHNYWRIKLNTLGKKQAVVIPQTWNYRTMATNDKILEFSCSRAIPAMKDVTVRSTEEGQLLSYRGFELSYVFDFVLWQGQLIFATGNGLYVSKPSSNVINCILSEPDLLFFSLCPLDDRLYIGTSDGLYCLRKELINKM